VRPSPAGADGGVTARRRSPHSNAYDPPLEDGTAPGPALRRLEVAANGAFETYRELYYDGGLSSVYLWDLDDGGFAGVVLLKKSACRVASMRAGLTGAAMPEGGGSWDSIHVFEAAERGRAAHYKLTSTVMLSLNTRGTALSGSMTRQIETDGALPEPGAHVGNVGRAVEEMESKMRNLLQEVYFGKTRDVVFELRSVDDLERARKQRELQRELVGFMKR
jgi:capping protein beta